MNNPKGGRMKLMRLYSAFSAARGFAVDVGKLRFYFWFNYNGKLLTVERGEL
jgi:hypothetical protein